MNTVWGFVVRSGDLALRVMSPWQWLMALLVSAVAVWLVFRLKSYFREDADGADRPLEMLTQFRSLHQEGGLTDDEFRLIRSRLANAAQGVRTTEPVKSKLRPADSKSLNSQQSSADPLNESHATAVSRANSERMPDDETESSC